MTRVVGIDLASSSYSAASLAEDGVPKDTSLFKPSNKKDSFAVRVVEFEKWLVLKLFVWQPDIVVVEETINNFQNPRAALMLAKLEGAAVLTAKKRKNTIVINVPISSSRSIVLSKGNLKKEDAFIEFKKMFPDFKMVAKSVGGMDQADAAVHAIAGPTHLERR